MTGISFTMEWPLSEQERIRQTVILQGEAIKNLTPIWPRFIGTILNRHRTTFLRQESPDGQPWTPLSDDYAERKVKIVKGFKAAQRKAAQARRGRKPIDVRKVIRNVRKVIKIASELSQGKISKSLVRSALRVARKASSRKRLGNILVLSGDMKRAASVIGAKGQMISTSPSAMVFSVMRDSVYPVYHQTTSKIRKDGKPIRRRWFGIIRPDFVELYAAIYAHIHGYGMRGAGGFYR